MVAHRLEIVTPVTTVGPQGEPGAPGAPGQGVIPGGTAGQVLGKHSNADYDTQWQDAGTPANHAATHAAAGSDPVTISESQVTGLVSDLAGKAPLSHTHSEADITGLATDLAAKAPTTRSINTSLPLSGGGDLTADRTISVNDFTSSSRGTVPASGGGTVNYLRADGLWVPPPGTGGGGSGNLDGGTASSTYGGTTGSDGGGA